MNQQEEQHNSTSRQQGVEPDLLPLGTLAAWVVGLTGVIVLTVLGLWQYFGQQIDAELLRKDLGRAHPALVETRARDERALTSYAQLDQQADRYRLPIARAMELLAQNPAAIAPLAAAPADQPKATATNASAAPGAPPATAGAAGAGPATRPGQDEQAQGEPRSAREAPSPQTAATAPAAATTQRPNRTPAGPQDKQRGAPSQSPTQSAPAAQPATR